MGIISPRAREADEAAVVAARLLLQLLAVGALGDMRRISADVAVPGMLPAAVGLDVVAAGEGQLARLLLLVQPPGRVDVHGRTAVVVDRRQVLERRDLPVHAGADGVHQPAPTWPLPLARPLGNGRLFEFSRMRADLARAGRQHHRPAGRRRRRGGCACRCSARRWPARGRPRSPRGPWRWVMIVRLPVASAGGISTVVDWKFAPMLQPRPQGVAQMQASRFCMRIGQDLLGPRVVRDAASWGSVS